MSWGHESSHGEANLRLAWASEQLSKQSEVKSCRKILSIRAKCWCTYVYAVKVPVCALARVQFFLNYIGSQEKKKSVTRNIKIPTSVIPSNQESSKYFSLLKPKLNPSSHNFSGNEHVRCHCSLNMSRLHGYKKFLTSNTSIWLILAWPRACTINQEHLWSSMSVPI